VRGVRRRRAWSGGAVTVDAWRERDGGETSVERRPMPLRVPRGARGTSASVPGPRRGFLAAARGVVRHGIKSAGRLKIISRSPV
jgi:hypothetical protein